MRAIWLTEANYNCRKKLKKTITILRASTISWYGLFFEYSTALVPITASGKKANSSKSLLLLGEMIKITIPMRNVKIIFL